MTGVETIDERARTEGASPFVYLALGVLFGITLVKSEAVSWFRIQEMFRFQAFHMYGIMGSALAVAALSVALIKRFHIKTLDGEPIDIPPKDLGRGHRYWAGGANLRRGLGVDRRVSGPALRSRRGGSDGGVGGRGQRRGRHVALRVSASEPAALKDQLLWLPPLGGSQRPPNPSA